MPLPGRPYEKGNLYIHFQGGRGLWVVRGFVWRGRPANACGGLCVGGNCNVRGLQCSVVGGQG